MTQEIIDILTKYEDRMRTAVYSNYTRSITLSDLTKLRTAYKELTGVEYSLKGSCSACQLTFLKKLGTIWFKRKESVQLSPTLITNELEETATTSDKSTNNDDDSRNRKTRKSNKK